MIFTREKFERYATQCPEGWRAAALAVATVTADTVEIAAPDAAALRARFWPAEKTKPRGLGDLVAAVAQPIAGAIDAITGSKIKECGGCKRRREKLNAAVPNVFDPFSK